MKPSTLSLYIAAILSTTASVALAEQFLPLMEVNADFRPAQALKTPISLTTIDNDIIQTRGAQHIEEILSLAPNVNISAGASRGQFFQVRGIGERCLLYHLTLPTIYAV